MGLHGVQFPERSLPWFHLWTCDWVLVSSLSFSGPTACLENSCIVFHCVDKPEFIKPLLCQWTFRLCPSLFELVYKIPQTGGFINNRNVLLTVLEAGKCKIKAPAKSCSDEGPLPDSWLLAVSPPCGRSERALWGLF